jgi:hypothetical protein
MVRTNLIIPYLFIKRDSGSSKNPNIPEVLYNTIGGKQRSLILTQIRGFRIAHFISSLTTGSISMICNYYRQQNMRRNENENHPD